jgi:hypothetical protein
VKTKRLGFLALNGILLLCAKAFGQALYIPRYQEPQPFTIQFSQTSVGAYTEGTFDETTFNNSGTKVSHEHLFAGN